MTPVKSIPISGYITSTKTYKFQLLKDISFIDARSFSDNPFTQYPVLRKIWKGGANNFNLMAKEATEDYRLNTAETGGIFLVIVDSCLVGITGYFLVDNHAVMRWHGIIPQHRGKGYNRDIMGCLLSIIRRTNPEVVALHEVTMTIDPIESFEKLGFKLNAVEPKLAEKLRIESGCSGAILTLQF